MIELEDEINIHSTKENYLSLYPFRNEVGLAVLFRKPVDDICMKYSLSFAKVRIPDGRGTGDEGKTLRMAHSI